MQISDAHKHYFWGAVVGAVGVLMVTYSWKFMLTPGEAERLGKTRAEAAVAQALAPFCVDKFEHEKNAAAKLVELKKLDQYQQAAYIEKGGWATLPGSTTPNSGAAKTCAEILAKKN